MHTNHPGTAAAALLGALVCALLCPLPVHAGEVEAGADVPGKTEPEPDVVRGRLLVRKGEDGEKRLEIRVGKTAYVIVGGDRTGAAKLSRKFVSARGRIDATGDAPRLRLGDDGEVTEQPRGPVLGTVIADDEGCLTLRGEATTYDVPRKAASKFKSFIGKHVTVAAFIVSAPGVATLESVKSVERKLLPGEREPTNGEAAVAGTWSGKIVAEKVPGGVPGVKPGDSFQLSFVTDAKLEKTNGRLMSTYDVARLKLRKFKLKDRTIDLDLHYSFSQGSYALRMRGVFTPDWKTVEGTWESGFLGSGTFKLELRDE